MIPALSARGRMPVAFAALFALLVAAPAFATEAPIQSDAAKLLGPDVKGDNWTVQPVVSSDGFVRIFTVDTPYGTFKVSGQRRMNERLHELRALQTLEKMSRTKMFLDAVGKAGLAPIRFGRDLVLDPIGTTGNVITGVGNMFDNVVSSVSSKNARRDPLFNSVVGITKAERDLAQTLQVDPYTDFLPLHKGLIDVARVVAAGDISVSAAISAIPGGAGIAVSASSTASTLSGSVYSKTSNELAALVRDKLTALGVEPSSTQTFIDNHFYSPTDQFAIADALEKLGADNSNAFVASAADAGSAASAKVYRYRVELLVAQSQQLGIVKSFVVESGAVLNRDATGRLIAAFPFDDVAWTDLVARSLTRVSTAVTDSGDKAPRIFATAGTLTPMAQDELKKLGWTILVLDAAKN